MPRRGRATPKGSGKWSVAAIFMVALIISSTLVVLWSLTTDLPAESFADSGGFNLPSFSGVHPQWSIYGSVVWSYGGSTYKYACSSWKDVYSGSLMASIIATVTLTARGNFPLTTVFIVIYGLQSRVGSSMTVNIADGYYTPVSLSAGQSRVLVVRGASSTLLAGSVRQVVVGIYDSQPTRVSGSTYSFGYAYAQWTMAVISCPTIGLSGTPITQPQSQVSIEIAVSGGQGGVCAGSACTSGSQVLVFNKGTAVTFAAWPAQGWAFDRFEGPGGLVSKQSSVVVVANSAGYVHAFFVPTPQTQTSLQNANVKVTVSASSTYKAGSPAGTYTIADAYVSGFSGSVQVTIFHADGPRTNEIVCTALPNRSTVSGQQDFKIMFLPDGPGIRYKVVVSDTSSGATLGSGYIDNVRYVLEDMTPAGTHDCYVTNSGGIELRDLVLLRNGLSPTVKEIDVQLPRENSQTIRNAIIEWYSMSMRYSQMYGGPSLYDAYPVKFTTAGIDATGRENLIIQYGGASMNCGSAAACLFVPDNTGYDSNGWILKEKMVLPEYSRLLPGGGLGLRSIHQLVLHEFGHMLGLGDLYTNRDPYYAIDVMSSYQGITTLDIYAALFKWQQSQLPAPLVAWGLIPLPSGVPYQIMIGGT